MQSITSITQWVFGKNVYYYTHGTTQRNDGYDTPMVVLFKGYFKFGLYSKKNEQLHLPLDILSVNDPQTTFDQKKAICYRNDNKQNKECKSVRITSYKAKFMSQSVK